MELPCSLFYDIYLSCDLFYKTFLLFLTEFDDVSSVNYKHEKELKKKITLSTQKKKYNKIMKHKIAKSFKDRPHKCYL